MKKKLLVFGSVVGGALSCLAEGSQATIADLGVTITDYMDSFKSFLTSPLGMALGYVFSVLLLYVSFRWFWKVISREFPKV